MASAPKLSVNIFEKDLGLAHFLKEAAKIRKKPFVKVGVTQAKGSKARPDGQKTSAEIATFHEFGLGVPERSFIRSTVTQHGSKYNEHIAKLKDQIFDANAGMTTERALGLIGQEVSADIKETIRAGISPPLKDATIRRKNAGEIAKAKAHLNAGGSAKDFTKTGQARNERAEKTVATGGESTALIDTGQMINAISYEVDMEGQGDAGYSGEGPSTF